LTVLRSGSASDVGRVRAVNEDMAFDTSPLYGVADGMGGHVGGDIAARTAVDALRAAFRERPTVEGLIAAVQQANTAVWEKGRAEPDLRGMGTTLTAAALIEAKGGEGDRLVLVNVGDSRAYRLRKGTLEQLTVDHSVAEELAARGELTPEEAATHPHRHILTRVLGVAPAVDVDAWELSPQVGDRYMICSDGFSNEVGPDLMTRILESVPEPDRAALELVSAANEEGGNDNITVVILDVEELDPKEQDPLADASDAAAGNDELDAPPVPLTRSAMLAGGGRGAGTLALERPPALSLIGDLPMDSTRALLEPDNEVSPEPKAKRRTADKRRRSQKPAERGPRLLTFRLVVFFLAVVAVLVGAWGFVRWYFDDSYFLTVDGSQIVVDQGRPGGFLWLSPRTIQRTGVTTSEVPANQVSGLRNGSFTASTPSAARVLIRHMVLAQCDYENGTPGVTTTTALTPGTPSIAMCPKTSVPQVSPPPTTSTTAVHKPSGAHTGPTSSTSSASTASTVSTASTSATATTGGTG
jgi:PPM family protein phosphatase